MIPRFLHFDFDSITATSTEVNNEPIHTLNTHRFDILTSIGSMFWHKVLFLPKITEICVQLRIYRVAATAVFAKITFDIFSMDFDQG